MERNQEGSLETSTREKYIFHKTLVIVEQGNYSLAIWARPIATGSYHATHYIVTVRIELNQERFDPFVTIRFHAYQENYLPTEVNITLFGGNATKEIASCHSEVLHSIIYNDYVSAFSFPIEEHDLIKLFASEVRLKIACLEDSGVIDLEKDDRLPLAQLKEVKAPNLLTEDQKAILLQEKKRLEDEERRIREEEEIKEEAQKKRELEECRIKAEKEREKSLFLKKVALSFAEYFINEKDRDSEEKNRLIKRQVRRREYLNDPRPAIQSIYSDFYYQSSIEDDYCIRNFKVIFKRIAADLGILYNGRLFVSNDNDVSVYSDAVLYFLKRQSVITDYSVGEIESCRMKPRMTIQQAEALIEVKESNDIIESYNDIVKVYNDIVKVWEEQDRLDFEKETTPAASPSQGCYIATCIYGSYDCPEVWTLRRYRDQVLDVSWFGRLFIKTYYTISPRLVRWFGDTLWFHKKWRKRLDIIVSRLRSFGLEDTPYNDKY